VVLIEMYNQKPFLFLKTNGFDLALFPFSPLLKEEINKKKERPSSLFFDDFHVPCCCTSAGYVSFMQTTTLACQL
jgi:hypothetical protein